MIKYAELHIITCNYIQKEKKAPYRLLLTGAYSAAEDDVPKDTYETLITGSMRLPHRNVRCVGAGCASFGFIQAGG